MPSLVEKEHQPGLTGGKDPREKACCHEAKRTGLGSRCTSSNSSFPGDLLCPGEATQPLCALYSSSIGWDGDKTGFVLSGCCAAEISESVSGMQ